MKHKAQAIFEALNKLITSDQTTYKYPNYVAVDNIPHQLTVERHMNFKTWYFHLLFTDHRLSEPNVSITINSAGGFYHNWINEESNNIDIMPYIEALLNIFKLADQFKFPISMKELDPFPENCNPFHHDSWRMGTQVSGGWWAMYDQHPGVNREGDPYPEPETLILVNSRTGRRFELDMTDANKPLVKEIKEEVSNG